MLIDLISHWFEAIRAKTVQMQGSTIGICCVRTYAYFYWCTNDFGYGYVDKNAHFFPVIV